MRKLAPRLAVKALLALTLLLGSLGAWAAAFPASAGGQAERVVAQALLGGEQVVQADRQPLSRAAADRRGDLGRFRLVVLGILVGAALLGVAWRWRGCARRTIHHPVHGARLAYASRAPPALRTA